MGQTINCQQNFLNAWIINFRFYWQSYHVCQEIIIVNPAMTKQKDYLRQSSKQCLFWRLLDNELMLPWYMELTFI